MTRRQRIHDMVDWVVQSFPEANLRTHLAALRALYRKRYGAPYGWAWRVARDELRRQRGDRRLSPWRHARCRAGRQPALGQKCLFETDEARG